MAEYGKNGNTHNLEHLQLKFKNASQWGDDEVLLAGEVGVELDTHKMKVGDGTTKWKSLPYSSDPRVQELVDGLTERVTSSEGEITNLKGRMDTAESGITSHGTRLDTAEGNITTHGTKITTLEGKMTSAESAISGLEAKDTVHETRMTTIEGKDTEQDNRLTSLEGITIISANPFRE